MTKKRNFSSASQGATTAVESKNRGSKSSASVNKVKANAEVTAKPRKLDAEDFSKLKDIKGFATKVYTTSEHRGGNHLNNSKLTFCLQMLAEVFNLLKEIKKGV